MDVHRSSELDLKHDPDLTEEAHIVSAQFRLPHMKTTHECDSHPVWDTSNDRIKIYRQERSDVYAAPVPLLLPSLPEYFPL
jgi:hypothetical protein